MIQRFLSVIAAMFLLAACETASTPSTDADGSSSSSSASGSSSASSSSSSGSSASSGSDAASAVEAAQSELATIGSAVYFDFDSSELSADAQEILDRQAAFLAGKPNLRITIEGHADERGTREYNLALGERRAAAARDYLVAKGINSARLRLVSYGKERPAVAGSFDAAWAKNRRAVTVLN